MTSLRTRRSALSLLVTTFALTGGVAHALPAGSPDPTWGDGGFAPYLAPSAAIDMYVQGNNKPVMLEAAVGDGFRLRRLNADGSIDRRFDGDGSVVMSSSELEPIDLAPGPEGKVMLLGRGPLGTYLVRLAADGAPDSSFNPGSGDPTGRRILRQAYDAFAVRADGSVVLAGELGGDFTLREVGANGIDTTTSFGSGGTPGYEQPRAVAFTDRGTVVAGDHESGSVIVGRWADSGKVDHSFGKEGFVRIDGMRRTLAVLPAGDAVFVVGTSTGADTATVVAKLDAHGELDRAYGTDGVATLDLDDLDAPVSVLQQPDGKLLVTSSNTGLLAIGAGRLDVDGTTDETFGGDGVINVFSGAALGGAAALSPSGRLVVSASGLLPGGLVTRLTAGILTEATGEPEPTPTQTPTPEPTTTAEPTPTVTVAATPAPAGTVAPTPTPAGDHVAPLVSVIDVRRTRKPSVRFALTESAAVELVVTRGKRSVRTVRQMAAAGVTRTPLGRLKRGRYTVTVVATDAAGNRSEAVAKRFRGPRR